MTTLGIANLGIYSNSTRSSLIQYGKQLAASFVPVQKEERRSDNTVAGNWRGEARDIFFFPINDSTGVEYAKQYSPLFFAGTLEESLDSIDCLIIYVNLIRLASPAKSEDIRGTLVARGFTVSDMNISQYRILLHSMGVPLRKLIDAQCQELDLGEDSRLSLREAEDSNNKALNSDSPDLAIDEDCVNHTALCALIGIYFNLITKKLTLQNINQWYKQRVKAYTKGANTAESMVEFEKFKPNLQFAEGVTSSLATCHDLKRMVFYMVKGLSTTPNHPLCEAAKTTMVYYRMAELTSFGMTLEWILARNPVLLTWNGLSKHLPYLKAAVDKYRAMGEDAPYCKLIYPPEQLVEFKGDKIGMITNVAFDIAVYEGQLSLLNYKGSGTSSLTPAMSRTCRAIVSHFAGAITHSIAATRKEVFHSLDPKSILSKLISSPALGEEDSETAEAGSVATATGIAPLDVN